MAPPIRFPKIIGHQGYGRQHAKYMLSALKTAADAQLDMIEIDIHETLDGRFIVHHDNAIQHDSPVWSQMTYSRLQQYENHYERAPLLSDCLEVIGAIPVDIEIKSCLDAEHLAKTLDAAPLAPGSVISSADSRVLKKLHRRGVQIPLFLIVAISHRRSAIQNIMNAVLCMAPRRLPDFLKGVVIHKCLVHKRLVHELSRKGITVFVWTVDELNAMRRFIALGVDGIITNCPNRLFNLIHPSERFG